MNQGFTDILSTIGQTPIVPLKRLITSEMAAVFGKYEAGNPTYSLKDRVALALVKDLEARSVLKAGDSIVVASHGNLGLALAMVCATKQYPLHIFMSQEVVVEKRLIPKTFGTEVHLVKCEHCFENVVKQAQTFATQTTGAHFIDQFDSPTMVACHAQTTALEIAADFPKGLDAFVMSVGTGATLTGVAQVLKQKFPHIKIVAVEPAACPVISGGKAGATKIQQIGIPFIPKNLDLSLIDRVISVSDDEAYRTTQQLAKSEGLLLGISSGANVFAALKVAAELGPSKKVLTVFCDQGQRYFSLKKYFKEVEVSALR